MVNRNAERELTQRVMFRSPCDEIKRVPMHFLLYSKAHVFPRLALQKQLRIWSLYQLWLRFTSPLPFRILDSHWMIAFSPRMITAWLGSKLPKQVHITWNCFLWKRTIQTYKWLSVAGVTIISSPTVILKSL